MSKPALGAGNVTITLDGEDVVLRPTLKAAQTISRMNGGIMSAVERVTLFDLEVITSVVAAGLDRPTKEIADDVWRTGCADLAPHVINFLSILANGGRPVGGSGGEGEENPRGA